jgi:hypothetical protein
MTATEFEQFKQALANSEDRLVLKNRDDCTAALQRQIAASVALQGQLKEELMATINNKTREEIHARFLQAKQRGDEVQAQLDKHTAETAVQRARLDALDALVIAAMAKQVVS